MNQEQRDRLSSSWQGRMQLDVNMAEYSTFRAGGVADGLIEVESLDELCRLLGQLKELQVSWRVIGLGSNILVSEPGYPGVIIRLSGALNGVTRLDKDRATASATGLSVRVGAGCSMAVLVAWCSRNGCSGLEFMAGIPGSVGGAVWMNAGAWGHEIGERLQGVEFVDNSGHLHRVPVSDLRLTYRQLALKEGRLEGKVIVSASFLLDRDSEERIRNRCRDYIERRHGKQPVGVASAGSFFKNPQGDSAGRLIEAAGMKGASCGPAMVSPVHANFIVNTGQATPEDIITLMQQVQDAVNDQFGVRLEPEVQII